MAPLRLLALGAQARDALRESRAQPGASNNGEDEDEEDAEELDGDGEVAMAVGGASSSSTPQYTDEQLADLAEGWDIVPTKRRGRR
eukprot:scaffold1093_cov359-Prasinococcus_capsulatus_cf.AAC.9